MIEFIYLTLIGYTLQWFIFRYIGFGVYWLAFKEEWKRRRPVDCQHKGNVPTKGEQ